MIKGSRAERRCGGENASSTTSGMPGGLLVQVFLYFPSSPLPQTTLHVKHSEPVPQLKMVSTRGENLFKKKPVFFSRDDRG